MSYIKGFSKEQLAEEVLHFQEVGSLALPRIKDLPLLPNIDYHYFIDPLVGCVGGDYVTFVNFDKYHLEDKITLAREKGDERLLRALLNNLNTFGILVADVAGHMISDNLTVNYLDAAFKTGIAYELKYNGHVTSGLFEMLNTNFYNRMTPDYLERLPYLTLLYGEMHNNGKFKYLSAGHPPPIIFSRKNNRIEALDDSCVSISTPFGMFPSKEDIDNEKSEPILKRKKEYCVNEIVLLGLGDIMLLYTDGLVERCESPKEQCEPYLEEILRQTKDGTAQEISLAIRFGLSKICPPDDDVSLVVVKKL